jgi:hypothetical protein
MMTIKKGPNNAYFGIELATVYMNSGNLKRRQKSAKIFGNVPNFATLTAILDICTCGGKKHGGKQTAGKRAA